jgi:selenoprotein W-related protein
LADELRKAFGVEATLTPGSGGAFEVTVDGQRIFSKLQNGRFPESGEIVQQLKKRA